MHNISISYIRVKGNVYVQLARLYIWGLCFIPVQPLSLRCFSSVCLSIRPTAQAQRLGSPASVVATACTATSNLFIVHINDGYCVETIIVNLCDRSHEQPPCIATQFLFESLPHRILGRRPKKLRSKHAHHSKQIKQKEHMNVVAFLLCCVSAQTLWVSGCGVLVNVFRIVPNNTTVSFVLSPTIRKCSQTSWAHIRPMT